jgi:hypothetical protein
VDCGEEQKKEFKEFEELQEFKEGARLNLGGRGGAPGF